jgi:hypothetical protein
MLNLRTAFLSIALVAIAVLTFGLATVWTAAIADPAGQPASEANALDHSDTRNFVDNNGRYRAQFGVCYDVPIRELAGCQQTSQVTSPAAEVPIDECYDVSIQELASCRLESQGTSPAERAPIDECYDVSIQELASCRKTGRAPAHKPLARGQVGLAQS